MKGIAEKVEDYFSTYQFASPNFIRGIVSGYWLLEQEILEYSKGESIGVGRYFILKIIELYNNYETTLEQQKILLTLHFLGEELIKAMLNKESLEFTNRISEKIKISLKKLMQTVGIEKRNYTLKEYLEITQENKLEKSLEMFKIFNSLI